MEICAGTESWEVPEPAAACCWRGEGAFTESSNHQVDAVLEARTLTCTLHVKIGDWEDKKRKAPPLLRVTGRSKNPNLLVRRSIYLRLSYSSLTDHSEMHNRDQFSCLHLSDLITVQNN